jgi:hypothetical protein
LDQTEYVLPEDGDRIQSPKRCALKKKRNDILDKNKTMDNVQKRNICKKTSVYQFMKSGLNLFSYFRVYINLPGKLLLALASTVIHGSECGGTNMKLNLLVQGRGTD